jgi:glutathione peroxidase-family protein
MTTVYDFEALSITGKKVPLKQYQGKVMLIVNTASACGFTPQFGGLEKLHETHGKKGLVVLGFPCNQFGAQDSGSNGEIAEFCQINYGVSFPMMAKVDVNGGDAHPCSSGCVPRRPVCWAANPSSGISPSFWSVKTVRCCAATPPPIYPRAW